MQWSTLVVNTLGSLILPVVPETSLMYYWFCSTHYTCTLICGTDDLLQANILWNISNMVLFCLSAEMLKGIQNNDREKPFPQVGI